MTRTSGATGRSSCRLAGAASLSRHPPAPSEKGSLLRTSVAMTASHVSKTFGVTKALDDVSMSVQPGSAVALLGRNGAGKSTLIAIMTGLLKPDEGTVQFPEAQEGARPVGCVYQRSALIPGLSAAENIAVNRFPRRRSGLIHWTEVRRAGRELLAEWNCASISDTLVEDLDPVDRKVVEICRVLSLNPRVLLLDEPTAGLDYGGAQRLFGHIEAAKRQGVGVVYVSHHLQECFDVCDSATVLRDGRVVMESSLEGLSVSDLVRAMVGDSVVGEEVTRAPGPDPSRAPVLTARGVTVPERVDDAGFHVRAGECVGITGLDGSGHIQVGEVLCGLTTPTAGTVDVGEGPLRLGSVRRSIEAGIGFVPEDRHAGGYVPAMSVAENATLPMIYRIASPLRIVRSRLRDRLYGTLADEWAIKAWGPTQPVEELSGGNQQKVVLARAVSSDPAVLVLMNPTAGVDVAAKKSIYSTIGRLAESGRAVVVVSSDDTDLAHCHRVVVMFRGKVHREMTAPFDEGDLAIAVQGG